MQREDAFDIDPGEIPDPWQLACLFRPIAEIHRRDQAITGACDIEQFGYVRRKADDTQSLWLVSGTDRSRQREQEPSQQQQTGSGQAGRPVQLSQPTIVSAANAVTQMMAMR